jgi:hypothetical protein
LYCNYKEIVVTFIANEKNPDCFVVYPPLLRTDLRPKREYERLARHAHQYRASPRWFDWKESISAMHLVSKEIKDEYLSFLYSRVEFRFSSAKWLKEFCTNGSKVGNQYVRKIRLTIHTYGQPEHKHNVHFVGKNYEAWKAAIRKMKEAMPNIEDLVVTMHVAEKPLIFTFREAWAQVPLELQGLSKLKNLRVVVKSGLLKPRWSWDDPTIEQVAHIWVNKARGLHYAFARALRDRILGEPELLSAVRYKKWVYKDMVQPNGQKLLVKVMGLVWVHRAKDWRWVVHDDMEGWVVEQELIARDDKWIELM